MGLFDMFRREPTPASIAKDRLQIIVARERRVGRGAPYLHQLQQELLAVVAKYEKVDLDLVTVSVDQRDDGEVLELNIVLPEETPAPPTGGGGARKPKKKRRKKKARSHVGSLSPA